MKLVLKASIDVSANSRNESLAVFVSAHVWVWVLMVGWVGGWMVVNGYAVPFDSSYFIIRNAFVFFKFIIFFKQTQY